MNRTKAILLLVFWSALFPRVGNAAKIYRLEGKIARLTPETVVIERGGEQFEFGRDTGAGREIPREARVGDPVTVFYTMDAHKITTKPRQKAGEAPSRPPVPQADDRLFFDAQEDQSQEGRSKFLECELEGRRKLPETPPS